jgi:hypothetical protein
VLALAVLAVLATALAACAEGYIYSPSRDATLPISASGRRAQLTNAGTETVKYPIRQMFTAPAAATVPLPRLPS